MAVQPEGERFPCSWESMWPHLLNQAAHLAKAAYERSKDEIGTSAASIILARASLDAFLSEFIEWRGLAKKIKRKDFYKKADAITAALGIDRDDYLSAEMWKRLALINDLRNNLVHHRADSFALHESPSLLVDKLCLLNVLGAHDTPMRWERRVACWEVAAWGCRSVAEAMLELESVPTKGTRSLNQVRQQLKFCMAPLTSSAIFSNWSTDDAKSPAS